MAKAEVKRTKAKKMGVKIDEISISAALVVRMAERMRKLTPTMRENMIARARKRLDGGHGGKNDAAIARLSGRE